MKHLSIFLLSSMVTFAADFITGQGARITVGQRTFTAQDIGITPSATVLGAVGGVAYANNTLFVVDSNHVQATPVYNRVMIYQNISQYVLDPTASIPQQGQRCAVCIGGDNGGAANLVLGQPDFVTTAINLTQNGLRTPTGIATNGQILAVTDTDNNRVLIWKSIPTVIGQSPDLVLGQPNFTTANVGLDNKSFRGPQGVWIQGNQFFVADTQNHRVMIWNSIPTTNDQPADLVLGEPNFSTAPAATVSDSPATASNMFSPVSVTSDGQRLFVTDLGHNRVLIWNSIPTQTQQAADVEIGQPNMTSELPNNSFTGMTATSATDTKNKETPLLCNTVTGFDAANNPIYPARCGATMDFPRYALSDGQHLFVADGGNDRIMVYNSIPTQNGQRADEIIGQPDEFSDQVTDSTNTFQLDANVLSSSPATVRSPLSLAWDGENLYVADPYDRRVLAFSIGTPNIPVNGITNAFSLTTYAVGAVNFTGTITAKDTVTITINGTAYTYTVVSGDSLLSVIQNFANIINGISGGTPDPNAVARPNLGFDELVLTAKAGGAAGNAVTIAVTTSTSATIMATTSGANLSGGTNAAELAPGTLITLTGVNLADAATAATPDANGNYPTTLSGVTLYIDGMRAPLIYVSPTQINAQMPFEVNDSNGVSGYVRTVHNDGSVTATTAIAIPIVPENPGLLAAAGADPRPAMAFHVSSNGIALVSVDGSIVAGDTATVTIQDRNYTYTLQDGDSLVTVRDALIATINSNPDEKVIATPAGQFTRIVLTAKVAGPDGNGITVAGSNSGSASIIITALNSSTCCASVAGTPVTADNPAVPGEVISLYATGLGLTKAPDGSFPNNTGQAYNGPPNTAATPVDNAQAGGTTANVLSSGLKPGMLGVYEVQIQLSSTLTTNPNTQVYIAQNVFTSNIVTIPVVNSIP
jgi:IPT/TIG domain-containing protein